MVSRAGFVRYNAGKNLIHFIDDSSEVTLAYPLLSDAQCDPKAEKRGEKSLL